MTTGREAHTFSGQGIVEGIAFSPTGRWLAAGSKQNLALWDVTTAQRVATLWAGAASYVVFSRDGRWLAANPGARFPGERLKVWDMRSRAVVAEFSIGTGGTPVRAIAFVDNDARLPALGPLSRSWSFTTDGETHALWSASSPIAASPDGKLLAAQDGIGGAVTIWDARSGRTLATQAAHSANLSTLAFSPNGRWLMTAGADTPPTARDRAGNFVLQWSVKVWDAAMFTERFRVAFAGTSAPSAAFSPDSRLLAVQKSWESIDLLDVDSGRTVGAFTARDAQPQNHQYSPVDVAFSADRRLLFQAAQNGVRVWTLPPVRSR